MMVRLASVSRVPWISWGSWALLSLFLCCTLGFYTTYACQDSSLVLHCPQNSVINIQSAFYGRRSDKICPYGDGASGKSQHWEGKWERLMFMQDLWWTEWTLQVCALLRARWLWPGWCVITESSVSYSHTLITTPARPSPNTWRWFSAASRTVRNNSTENTNMNEMNDESLEW